MALAPDPRRAAPEAWGFMQAMMRPPTAFGARVALFGRMLWAGLRLLFSGRGVGGAGGAQMMAAMGRALDMAGEAGQAAEAAAGAAGEAAGTAGRFLADGPMAVVSPISAAPSESRRSLAVRRMPLAELAAAAPADPTFSTAAPHLAAFGPGSSVGRRDIAPTHAAEPSGELRALPIRPRTPTQLPTEAPRPARAQGGRRRLKIRVVREDGAGEASAIRD